MSAINLALERLRQARRAWQADLAAAGASAQPRDAGLAGPLAAGARVFDTVTGEEGIVVGVTAENVLVPVARRGAR